MQLNEQYHIKSVLFFDVFGGDVACCELKIKIVVKVEQHGFLRRKG